MIEYPVIDPVAVSLGPFNIHWYAVTYLVGFLICWRILLSLSDAQRQTWRKEQLWDLISYGVFGVILGGRMGYVLFYGFGGAVTVHASELENQKDGSCCQSPNPNGVSNIQGNILCGGKTRDTAKGIRYYFDLREHETFQVRCVM